MTSQCPQHMVVMRRDDGRKGSVVPTALNGQPQFLAAHQTDKKLGPAVPDQVQPDAVPNTGRLRIN